VEDVSNPPPYGREKPPARGVLPLAVQVAEETSTTLWVEAIEKLIESPFAMVMEAGEKVKPEAVIVLVAAKLF